MATFFKNKVIKDVGKQAVEVYTTGAFYKDNCYWTCTL